MLNIERYIVQVDLLLADLNFSYEQTLHELERETFIQRSC